MTDTYTSYNNKDPLDRLKDILLQDNQKRIEELQNEIEILKEQLSDKNRLIETINPIFADLLDRKIYESKDEMAELLAPVMGKAIKKQVRESKEDVIDALYPVIGKMITKAISEAMKTLIENVNHTINKSFNFSLWRKRIKAKIFGIEVGEVIVAESAHFEIEELFLIEKESGLLISYASKEEDTKNFDADIISGMLTAIKTFVEEAFASGEEGELKEIEYSTKTIYIESGRYTYLAAVCSGFGNETFRQALRKYHHKIHNRFYKLLRNYDGDNSKFLNAEKILKELITKQSFS